MAPTENIDALADFAALTWREFWPDDIRPRNIRWVDTGAIGPIAAHPMALAKVAERVRVIPN
jgi:hypothetical protein